MPLSLYLIVAPIIVVCGVILQYRFRKNDFYKDLDKALKERLGEKEYNERLAKLKKEHDDGNAR